MRGNADTLSFSEMTLFFWFTIVNLPITPLQLEAFRSLFPLGQGRVQVWPGLPQSTPEREEQFLPLSDGPGAFWKEPGRVLAFWVVPNRVRGRRSWTSFCLPSQEYAQ